MKKWGKCLICAIALCTTILSSFVSEASDDDHNNNDISYDVVDTYSIELTDDVINSQNIHLSAIESGILYINDDGHLYVDGELSDVSSDDWETYLNYIDNMNDIVDLNIASYNTDYTLNMLDSDEIEEIIYNEEYSVGEDNTFADDNEDVVLAITDAGYPKLMAYSIASHNKQTLKNFMDTLLVSNKTHPEQAVFSTISFWVAKVKTNGAWDYKNVPGYAPYNKKWTAVQKNYTSARTSEWFGNYNYGFTGSLLFPCDTLLLGGDAVSWAHNGEKDSPEDKSAIRQGFNEGK